MNLENEKIRVLTNSITHYEKMGAIAAEQSKRDEYKRKARQCRDELNYILKGVVDG